ncbi:MAG: 30S ribosomal protein S2 [Lentisphaeria bacterium]|nr:30S ribosomal protein S2 [Lentisphaeria bacterium]
MSNKITIKDLLDAGVHFGHPTKRWNPKMKPYVYGQRNGIYIFDLPKTMKKLQEACQFLYKSVAEGGEILFVGTKRQVQEVIKESAQTLNMFHMCERWLGGTLTNNQTIRKSIKRMNELKAKEESGELEKLPKKEASSIRRELGKLENNLSGIVEMKKLPAALFVVDVERESIAVAEANKLHIPVVGIVDSNCNPAGIDYIIPANDDAVRSVKLILTAVETAVQGAQSVWQKTLEEQEAAKAKAEEEARRAKEAAKKEKEAKAAEAKAKKEADKVAKKEAKAEEAPAAEAKAEAEEAPAAEEKAAE